MQSLYEIFWDRRTWREGGKRKNTKDKKYYAISNLEVREDQRFLDLLPDDTGHLIAIEFNNRVGHLNTLVSRVCCERER